MKASRHLIIAASMAILTLAPALQAKPHNGTGQGHQPDPRSQADTRINIDSQLIRDIFRDNAVLVRSATGLIEAVINGILN